MRRSIEAHKASLLYHYDVSCSRYVVRRCLPRIAERRSNVSTQDRAIRRHEAYARHLRSVLGEWVLSVRGVDPASRLGTQPLLGFNTVSHGGFRFSPSNLRAGPEAVPNLFRWLSPRGLALVRTMAPGQPSKAVILNLRHSIARCSRLIGVLASLYLRETSTSSDGSISYPVVVEISDSLPVCLPECGAVPLERHQCLKSNGGAQ